MIKKVWEYIKNNKLYIMAMAIGLLLFMLLMNFVVLYADDLGLGVISKTGLEGAFKHLGENYMNWGGGPTPFIAIIFLMFNLNVWKVFNCIIIFAMIVLVVRMVSYHSKVNKGIIAIILWALVFILNIYISAETLYWLDGNLAYVLTGFQMLLFLYYLYSRLIMKTKPKKYDYILLPLVAFSAGWTGPQAGALTVIIAIILLTWTKFVNKEKIKPIYYVSGIIALIGFLVYYLAPGNNARLLEGFPQLTDYGLVEKISHQMNSVWRILFDFMTYRFASVPLYLYMTMGLLSIVSIKMIKKEENEIMRLAVRIMGGTLIAFLLINFAIFLGYNPEAIFSNLFYHFEPILQHMQEGTFSVKMLIPYATTSVMLLFTAILAYYISTKEKSPLLFIFVLGALAGQAMMLLSPYSPLRSTFITVMLLWFAIAYLAKVIFEQEVSVIWIIALLIGMMYDVKLMIIILLAYAIMKAVFWEKSKENKKEMTGFKVEYSILLVVTVCLAISVYYPTIKGYQANKVIYEENIQLIEEFKAKKESNILYLKEPVDPKYGFTSFIGIGWIETDTKEYFGLDKDVVIKSMNKKTE